jgi:hypothetical protein
MDPNKALSEILQLQSEYNNSHDPERRNEIVHELFNSFNALDYWLRFGGFLPDRWDTAVSGKTEELEVTRAM